jgi:hypothetical protein
MAIRGIVTTLSIYAANYATGDAPLYAYQNYFPGTRTINSEDYVYNSFQISDIGKARDASPTEVSITFSGTAANVDLVEAATVNGYEILVFVYRWSAYEGLEDPTSFNFFAAYGGRAIGGSADLSTASLALSEYNSTLNGDMPWRKIPWTILGPLSFRR